MEELEVLVHDAADIVRGNYDLHKYSSFFTVWGVGYHFDEASESFLAAPVASRFNGLIPGLFDCMKQDGVVPVKPKLYVPKVRDEPTHYSLMGVRNQGLLAQYFCELLEFNSDSAFSIVNDNRLLSEAADEFVHGREEDIPSNVDFFDFLLHYTRGNEFSLENASRGQFSSLLERLIVRYELTDDLFDQIKNHVPEGDFSLLASNHLSAVNEKKPSINSELVELCQKYAAAPGEGEMCSSRYERVAVSPRSVLGRRRVRVGCGSDGYCIDIENLAERVRSKGVIQFDPNTVLRQQVVNALLDQYLVSFRADPAGTVRSIEDSLLSGGDSEEAKALNTVLELLHYVRGFDEDDRINHQMTLRRKT